MKRGMMKVEQSKFLVTYNENEFHEADTLDEVKTVIESLDKYPNCDNGESFDIKSVKAYEIKREVDIADVVKDSKTVNWYAEGDKQHSSIVIHKNGTPVVCILPEQVIHGLEYSRGSDLKCELRLGYMDILEELGLE
jgi:hypothetical protein